MSGATTIAVPAETLIQWAFIASRISGVISGANAAFAKHGGPLESLTDGEGEADTLRSQIMALVIGASAPVEGGVQ